MVPPTVKTVSSQRQAQSRTWTDPFASGRPQTSINLLVSGMRQSVREKGRVWRWQACAPWSTSAGLSRPVRNGFAPLSYSSLQGDSVRAPAASTSHYPRPWLGNSWPNGAANRDAGPSGCGRMMHAVSYQDVDLKFRLTGWIRSNRDSHFPEARTPPSSES